MKSTKGEKIRGRFFSPDEIQLINEIVETNFDKGRSCASIAICKALDWKQPNGWLKDRACRDVLRSLERKGYIKLPPTKKPLTTRLRDRNRQTRLLRHIDKSRVYSIDFKSLQVRQVKGTREENLWNTLVDKYHYLGFKVFVGRALKYFVYYEDRIVAALGFCDSVWTINIRDKLLANFDFGIEEIRLKGMNNGRFLIMPWVKIPNLASHLLALTIKKARVDWSEYYSVEPLYVETFVDPTKFTGTCYKAANWIYLGKSSGYYKSGSIHYNSQIPKLMFIYVFNRKLRTKVRLILEES